ncbi:FAD-dependent oxidoreductase [Pseudomonas sp. MDMC_285]|nr:FAD-dependent oxidoreductase [Pseudomonas sp. MDMC_285]
MRQPIVIIGSGYAGYGLAQALRRADAEVEIRVLTQESGHLYSKPALSIGLAQGKSADALAGESALAIEKRLKIRVYPHCTVSASTPRRGACTPISVRWNTASWCWPAVRRRFACPSKGPAMR